MSVMEVVNGTRRVIIAVHTAEAPSDAEWAAYMDLLQEAIKRASTLDGIGIIVVTDGGSPTIMQRAKLNRLLKERSLRTAVVTRSAIARAATAALALLNSGMRPFDPSAFAEALGYLTLSLTPELRQRLVDASAALPEAKTLRDVLAA